MIADEASTKKLASEEGAEKVASERPRDESFNEVAKKVFIAFREAERAYMRCTDRQDVNEAMVLKDGNELMRLYAVCNLRHHLEVFLTLRGLKPCTLFYFDPTSVLVARLADTDATVRLMTAVVLKIFVQIFERFELESYGFRLLSLWLF